MKQVTEADFDAVYDIYMDKVVNPFMGFGIMDKESFRPVYADLLKRDYFWLFQHEGQNCGICSAIIGKGRSDHVATICSLGVTTAFQGKGLGRKIMTDVIGFLGHKNIKRIDLIVEADNARAIPFYESLGFKIDGTCPKAFKRENSDVFIDQIIMSIT